MSASVKLHENIRMQVAMLLKNIIKGIASEKCKIFGDLYSCTLLKLVESPEITVLMPQEIRVGVERKWVDMALGSSIMFEFKSSESEFKEAEEKAKTVYWSLVSKARYFIVTNWLRWRIYGVTKQGLQLVEECDRDRAETILKTQVIPELKALKIPPIPRNVEILYT